MKRTIFTILYALSIFIIAAQAHAQVFGDTLVPLEQWIMGGSGSNRFIRPISSSTIVVVGANSTSTLSKLQTPSLSVTGLGGGGTLCVQVNNSGTLAVAAAACGTGGAVTFLANGGAFVTTSTIGFTAGANITITTSTDGTYTITGSAGGGSGTVNGTGTVDYYPYWTATSTLASTSSLSGGTSMVTAGADFKVTSNLGVGVTPDGNSKLDVRRSSNNTGDLIYWGNVNNGLFGYIGIGANSNYIKGATNSNLILGANNGTAITIGTDNSVTVATTTFFTGGVNASGTMIVQGATEFRASTTMPTYVSCTLKTDTNGLITCGTDNTGGGGGSVSTSSPITVNHFPYWTSVGGGLSGTSTITINGTTVNATGTLTVNGNQVSTSTGANPTASVGTSAVNGSANTFMRSDAAPAINQAATFSFSALGNTTSTGNISAASMKINGSAVSTSTGANPTASVGLSAVNGSANTFMRSDGAPALSQSITPTWSALHTFGGGLTAVSTSTFASSTIFSGITNALIVTNSSGLASGYGGSVCSGTNQVVSVSATGTVTCAAASPVTTSTAVTANYFPYWFNATGGLSGTSTIYQSLPNVGIGTTQPSSTLHVIATNNPTSTFRVSSPSGATVFDVNGTSTTDNILEVQKSNGQVALGVASSGIPLFFGTSTPSLGGSALVAGQCSTVTTDVPLVLSSSTDSVFTMPQVDPGEGDYDWYSVITGIGAASTTITTKVCSVVAGTPTSIPYHIFIMRKSGL